MLEWLAHTRYAEWVDQSWGWPVALTVHAFGTATVIGLTFIIGLRLLGSFQAIPYSALNKLIPLVWIAVVCQVASGLTLWMTKPAQYLADGMFEVKMAFLVASIIVTVVFQRIVNGEAVRDADGPGLALRTAGPYAPTADEVPVIWRA